MDFFKPTDIISEEFLDLRSHVWGIRGFIRRPVVNRQLIAMLCYPNQNKIFKLFRKKREAPFGSSDRSYFEYHVSRHSFGDPIPEDPGERVTQHIKLSTAFSPSFSFPPAFPRDWFFTVSFASVSNTSTFLLPFHSLPATRACSALVPLWF